MKVKNDQDPIAAIRERHATNDCRTYTMIHAEHRQCHEDCRTLLRRVDELEERLARIAAVAEADAQDMKQIRDGTKLTRHGLVETIAYWHEEATRLRADLTATEERADRAAAAERKRCAKIVRGWVENIPASRWDEFGYSVDLKMDCDEIANFLTTNAATPQE